MTTRFPGTLPLQPPQLAATPLLCDSASVREGAALVLGSTDNSCALPGAASAGQFVGLAVFAGSASTGATIYVITGGFYQAIASGTITRGDSLVIADALGGVKSVTSTIADQASIVGMAMESAIDGARVNIRIAGTVTTLGRPTTLISQFVAGTGGVTAGAVVVVDSTTNNQVVLPSGSDPTKGVVGISLNTAVATATAFVVTYGPASGVASGGITRADNLAVVGTTGKVKLAAPSAGTNSMCVGTALASAADTAAVSVFVHPGWFQG